MMICQGCDEPAGAAHLDTCPLRMSQAFLGHLVSVFECVRVDDNHNQRREDDLPTRP